MMSGLLVTIRHRTRVAEAFAFPNDAAMQTLGDSAPDSLCSIHVLVGFTNSYLTGRNHQPFHFGGQLKADSLALNASVSCAIEELPLTKQWHPGVGIHLGTEGRMGTKLTLTIDGLLAELKVLGQISAAEPPVVTRVVFSQRALAFAAWVAA
jgi:hypothetical protein